MARGRGKGKGRGGRGSPKDSNRGRKGPQSNNGAQFHQRGKRPSRGTRGRNHTAMNESTLHLEVLSKRILVMEPGETRQQRVDREILKLERINHMTEEDEQVIAQILDQDEIDYDEEDFSGSEEELEILGFDDEDDSFDEDEMDDSDNEDFDAKVEESNMIRDYEEESEETDSDGAFNSDSDSELDADVVRDYLENTQDEEEDQHPGLGVHKDILLLNTLSVNDNHFVNEESESDEEPLPDTKAPNKVRPSQGKVRHTANLSARKQRKPSPASLKLQIAAKSKSWIQGAILQDGLEIQLAQDTTIEPGSPVFDIPRWDEDPSSKSPSFDKFGPDVDYVSSPNSSADTPKTKKPLSKAEVKQKRAFSLQDLHRLNNEIRTFVQNGTLTSTPFSPMTKFQRIQLHHLVSAYGLKAQSFGSGSRRFIQVEKTVHTTLMPKEDSTTLLGTLLQRNNEFAENISKGNKGKHEKGKRDKKGKKDGRHGSKHKGGKSSDSPNEDSTKKKVRIVGQNAAPIDESNIGNKLLRSLGWTGGGLGSQGQGIVDPLSAVIKHNRRGLGSL